MTAQERLAAVLASVMYEADPISDDLDDASRLLAADPHLAQDIEDGAALRRLREVLPEGGWYFKLWSPNPDASGFEIEVCLDRRWTDPDVAAHAIRPTIAQAADACREAIEAQR